MTVPKNVLWFEVLLYLSLTLDSVSVAFQDRTPNADMTEQMIDVGTVMAAGLILLLVYFVWLAAQHRKSWPRWVLAAALRAVGDFAGAGDRPAKGVQVRQRHRGGLLCADRDGAVLLLHRRRGGMVRRVDTTSVIPGRVEDANYGARLRT